MDGWQPSQRARGPEYDPLWYRRTLAPAPITTRGTLPERSLRWILPWTIKSYPGIRRGILELLGRRWGWSAIRGWRSGRRKFNPIAAEIMAYHIEASCKAGLALVDELRAYALAEQSKPRRNIGWAEVRDRDGVISDARNRTGNIG